MTTAVVQRAMLGAFSDPQGPGIVQQLLQGVISVSNEALEAHLVARIRVAGSRLLALRQSTNEDEFEATFDLIARPRLFLEFASILQDPTLERLAAANRARALSPQALMNPKAMEYAEDLVERTRLLFTRDQVAPPSTRGWAEDNARGFVAFMALALAAHDRHAWHPWMVGMLWNLGRRATVEMAKHWGLTWEEATDLLVTKRDRAIAAKPFDQAASDEARRTLGLH